MIPEPARPFSFKAQGAVVMASCRDALTEPGPRRAVREILLGAVQRADRVAAVLGKPSGGVDVLYKSAELTVLNVVWAPRMSIYP